MTRDRKLAILSSIFFVVLGWVLSWTYRPYIYQNNIFDYHFADTIGSWVCVPAASLFFYGVRHKRSFSVYVLLNTVTFVLYELLGLARIHGTFDYYDIVVTCISGLLTYSAYRLVKAIRIKKQGQKSNDY